MTRKHKDKSNPVLLAELKSRISIERSIIAEVVEYLNEVELRNLHLSLGHSSMFAFCTQYLGYSEQEAYIRIQAARLLRAVPDLGGQLETGQISLTVAAMAQSKFRSVNKKRKESGQPLLTNESKEQTLRHISNLRLLCSAHNRYRNESCEPAQTI